MVEQRGRTSGSARRYPNLGVSFEGFRIAEDRLARQRALQPERVGVHEIAGARFAGRAAFQGGESDLVENAVLDDPAVRDPDVEVRMEQRVRRPGLAGKREYLAGIYRDRRLGTRHGRRGGRAVVGVPNAREGERLSAIERERRLSEERGGGDERCKREESEARHWDE